MLFKILIYKTPCLTATDLSIQKFYNICLLYNYNIQGWVVLPLMAILL